MKKSLKKANSKYLIFTSAGENANIPHWIKGHKDFDLWVSYYGEQENKFEEYADYYVAKKGGKFPNFYFFYQKYQDIISQYDAVLITDDDLIISATELTKLFHIREQYDLWILQPSFDRRGKVSFELNEVQALSTLRYSNFIEVTCPLFSKDKLDEFMAIYDPKLIGWGVDIWFSEVFSKQDIDKNKIAIIDEVSCINPRDKTKIGQLREIDKLQNTDKRKEVWQSIQLEHKLDLEFKRMEYSSIKAPFSIRELYRATKITGFKLIYTIYKTIKRESWRPS